MAGPCELETRAKYYVLKKGGTPAASKEVPAQAKAPAKKPKAPVVAKSSVTLKIWPQDPEKPITELYETEVKAISIEGLTWGVPFSVVNGPYGLKGLQFGCVIVDDLVKTDDIEEAIETIGMKEEDVSKYVKMRRNGQLDEYEEDWPNKRVGSVEVVSFQKI